MGGDGFVVRKSVEMIHLEAVEIAKCYLGNEFKMVEILGRMHATRGFRDYSKKSLKRYAIECLNLSENVAETMITIVRKSIEVPQLKAAFSRGEIDISKTRRLASVVTRDNCADWIEFARTATLAELDRKIAGSRPFFDVKEVKIVRAKNRIERRFGVSTDLDKRLDRAQDLVSQKLRRPASFEATAEEMVEVFLNRHDPVRKAARAFSRRGGAGVKDGKPVARRVFEDAGENIPAEVIHEVNLRDGGQCTYVEDNGHRCQERRWLDFHHIIPVHRGGPHTAENLTTVCKAHHQLIHHNKN